MFFGHFSPPDGPPHATLNFSKYQTFMIMSMRMSYKSELSSAGPNCLLMVINRRDISASRCQRSCNCTSANFLPLQSEIPRFGGSCWLVVFFSSTYQAVSKILEKTAGPSCQYYHSETRYTKEKNTTYQYCLSFKCFILSNKTLWHYAVISLNLCQGHISK
jgi:hypothetical protein